ncbi:MAG: 4Fe-4S dicluster domain-containing protein [Chloroflexi bacterium]|nr:MAG: 4Fe-4S dicluster domain-containing protein [Chloroflexota bacterium]
MLTIIEKIAFVILALFSLGATYQGFVEMYAVINRGGGKLHLDNLPRRMITALYVYLSQRTLRKARPLTSLLHLGVAWGFTFYFLVNLGDVLEGYIPDYEFLGTGVVADVYRLLGDVFSVAVLVGVVYFILRRLVLTSKRELQFHDNVLLHPKVASGAVRRDSLLVAGFILVHVGARFLGESVAVAMEGSDPFQPFAGTVALLWGGVGEGTLNVLVHVWWWIGLGAIALFTPYFPHTKHAHLFMAPLNFLTRPQRTALGALEALDFEDESIEQFGANKIEHLAKTQILDAYACIMCNRCQDVCPAYVTGKELSPSALEVNKRYMIKDQLKALASGEESAFSLLGMAISDSALWACTSCGACIDVCPVGNEPMFDIIDIRRDAVLMQSEFPAELQGAFAGMERQGNPWQLGEPRFAWADDIDIPVPTVEENPDFDVLFWVGCAGSYEQRAQTTTRAMVRIMHAAGVNFAVLGNNERCTGDTARRAGNEYLYFEMASANVELLNDIAPKRIVVTCPHCFHNLAKEYQQFGGHYEVVHHTEFIEELIAQNKLPQNARPNTWSNVTFHDPCYLGRHNGVTEAPRNALTAMGAPLVEMARNRSNSFCCGAGGAQFWKEEEHGSAPVNITRYNEAKDTGAETMAVGCPFCMRMFEDASQAVGDGPQVKDVAELIAERLP